MKLQTLLWMIVIAIGVVLLAIRLAITEYGTSYVRQVPKSFVEVERPSESVPGTTETVWVGETAPEATAPGVSRTGRERIAWTKYETALQADKNQAGVSLSKWRTLGLWIAAFLTLCIFSFLWGDNPFYKLAESIFIGVSAAYWMVVQFWSVIVPNLIGKLAPGLVKSWAHAGAGDRAHRVDLSRSAHSRRHAPVAPGAFGRMDFALAAGVLHRRLRRPAHDPVHPGGLPQSDQ
jgi:hypothetical protein